MNCWRKEKRQQNYTLNCPCMKVMCYLCRKTIQGTNDWWLLRGQFCTETIKSIEVESHTKDGVLRHYDGSLLTLIDRSLQFRNIFLGRNRNGYADGIIISIATPSCKQYATCHGNGQHGECSPNQKHHNRYRRGFLRIVILNRDNGHLALCLVNGRSIIVCIYDDGLVV